MNRTESVLKTTTIENPEYVKSTIRKSKNNLDNFPNVIIKWILKNMP